MKISLLELKKKYGGFYALDDVSLDIPENRICGIIGKSGAGKSTLVRHICLLERPDSGQVLYDGVRVDNLPERESIQRRRRIGVIFQNFNLLSSRNAFMNVAYPLEISGNISRKKINERVSELLETVGLKDKMYSPISTLSGGQKQRVAIARALVRKPDVLFCDEATSALDPQTTRSILLLIKDIQKQMNLTVVMITHQMEVVRDSCDYVGVLNEGKIVEFGSVKDIFSNPGTDITKDFLLHLPSVDVDRDSIVFWSKIHGRYTLRFSGSETDSPIISKMTREYDVDFNIRGGGVQHVGDAEFGTLICDITGSEEQVSQVVRTLRENNVIVEESPA